MYIYIHLCVHTCMFLCVYISGIKDCEMCVCVYIHSRNQHNKINLGLFFGVLVSPFLSTHNVIAIAGLLENSGAGTQS